MKWGVPFAPNALVWARKTYAVFSRHIWVSTGETKGVHTWICLGELLPFQDLKLKDLIPRVEKLTCADLLWFLNTGGW